MAGLIIIFVFVVLMAMPGFYIITRTLFPKNSKRSALWISVGLTLLLVAVLAWGTLGSLAA